MKKKIILLFLFVVASLSGWAQSISITSISPSVQAGNTLTVSYTYTSAAACKVSCGVYLMDDWTWVSTVVFAEVNPAESGTKTGTFNLVIPAGTTPKLSLTGALNYKVQAVLSNLSGGWLAGDYSVSNYNITAPAVAIPAVSFTSVPASTQVGSNLVVNYKYTAPSGGGKVAINISKNGGVNPWDYISNVIYDELAPTIAGTDLTGTFTLPIPSDITPTSGLTGNQNYQIKIELLDSNGNWLAGNYDYTHYNFTAAAVVPAVIFTSIPNNSQAGINLIANYKYSSPSAGGKVAITISKNGGTNPWDYISTVAYSELTPTIAGVDILGSFTIPIPSDITPTVGLTGNENYRIKIELLDSSGNWLAGNYDYTNYNFTAPSYSYYLDADGDRYGTGSVILLTSPIAPSGYSVNNTDCDDTKSSVYPGATEIFDGIDNDCDGAADEGAALPSSLTFCKGATVATARGTTDLQLYTALTGGSPIVSSAALASRIYWATLNGSARTAVTVTVISLPTQAIGTITSNTAGTTAGTFAAATVAVGPFVGTATTVSYRVPAFTSSDAYFWTVPAGVRIVGQAEGVRTVTQTGANGNVLNVNYSGIAAGIGSVGAITVQAQNSNGCNGTAKSITVAKALPLAPAAITMHDLSLPLPTSGIPTAVRSFAKYMGTNAVLRLTATPSVAATSYEWNLPAGVNQLSGGTTNVITVNFAGVTSANTDVSVPANTNVLRIGVKAVNGVGVSTVSNSALVNPTTTSTARLLTLTAVAPAAPTLKMFDMAVSSTVAVTDISRYIGTNTPLTLVGAVTATTLASSFSWELAEGVNVVAGSVLSSNSIMVNFEDVEPGTASLYVGIKAVNGMGSSIKSNTTATPATSSTATLLKLSAGLPSAAGTVVGSLAICSNQPSSVTYTITAAASKTNVYIITSPVGTTITGGTGNTRTINAVAGATFTVNYPNGFTSVKPTQRSISIQSANGFGVSFPKLLTLTSNACTTNSKTAKVAPIAQEFKVIAYPNPSTGVFNLAIESSKASATTIQVYDMQGRMIERKQVNTNAVEIGANYTSGIYNVILENAGQAKTIRLIKK